VLAGVAASGDALCPMFVTSRAVPGNVYHAGHHPGNDFITECNNKPYSDSSLFECFIRQGHIPHVTSMRMIPCCSRAEAFLMVDNCSSHVTGEIFRLLGENYVKIVTFPRHTTNVFQALDLSFFGGFNRKENLWMEQEDNKTFAATIHTFVRQFHSVATP
jgi:hypothetical protein